MAKKLGLGGLIVGLVTLGWYVLQVKGKQIEKFISPVGQIMEQPVAKYAFERLRQRQYQATQINLDRVIEEKPKYTAYLFSFLSDNQKVTGQANIPKISKKAPVIVMLRGYVDKEVYTTGIGTRKAAAVLSENGFVTVAADFLGYGESDPESNDMLEARFEKLVTALNLLASVCSLPQADCQKVGLWGHSNGGYIALSVLAISGREIPTTLWAPVSKPFPYDILYYSDDLSDRGKLLRAAVAEFERSFNADDYSVQSYYKWIKAPVQIHQGTADEAVPKGWSDALVNDLKPDVTDITYHVYSVADHNLEPNWNTVVQRDVAWFRKHL